MTPGTKDDIVKLHTGTGFTPYRSYFSANRANWKISEWVNLTAGEEYYLNGAMIENTGGDHMQVAVEIEQSAIQKHHHGMKEI